MYMCVRHCRLGMDEHKVPNAQFAAFAAVGAFPFRHAFAFGILFFKVGVPRETLTNQTLCFWDLASFPFLSKKGQAFVSADKFFRHIEPNIRSSYVGISGFNLNFFNKTFTLGLKSWQT